MWQVSRSVDHVVWGGGSLQPDVRGNLLEVFFSQYASTMQTYHTAVPAASSCSPCEEHPPRAHFHLHALTVGLSRNAFLGLSRGHVGTYFLASTAVCADGLPQILVGQGLSWSKRFPN